MKKDYLQPQKDERPVMIITGIWTLYIILICFLAYLCFLHRISVAAAIIGCIVVTLLHIPRFLMLKKLKLSPQVKVNDDNMTINSEVINFWEIKNFASREYKPHIIFFLNNRMVIFQQTDFIINTASGDFSFTIIGSEKANLLKDLLTKIKERNYLP